MSARLDWQSWTVPSCLIKLPDAPRMYSNGTVSTHFEIILTSLAISQICWGNLTLSPFRWGLSGSVVLPFWRALQSLLCCA